jgi:hypothetical protein
MLSGKAGRVNRTRDILMWETTLLSVPRQRYFDTSIREANFSFAICGGPPERVPNFYAAEDFSPDNLCLTHVKFRKAKV